MKDGIPIGVVWMLRYINDNYFNYNNFLKILFYDIPTSLKALPVIRARGLFLR